MYVLHLHVAVGVAPTTYRNSPAAVVIVVVHLDNLYRNSVIGYRIKLLEPATLSPANPRSCPIVMSLSHTHTYTHTHTHTHTHALSLSHSHSLTLSLSREMVHARIWCILQAAPVAREIATAPQWDHVRRVGTDMHTFSGDM
jgi:hypothetical protein